MTIKDERSDSEGRQSVIRMGRLQRERWYKGSCYAHRYFCLDTVFIWTSIRILHVKHYTSSTISDQSDFRTHTYSSSVYNMCFIEEHTCECVYENCGLQYSYERQVIHTKEQKRNGECEDEDGAPILYEEIPCDDPKQDSEQDSEQKNPLCGGCPFCQHVFTCDDCGDESTKTRAMTRCEGFKNHCKDWNLVIICWEGDNGKAMYDVLLDRWSNLS